VLRGLGAVGYRVVGTDQEPGHEGEADVAGPHGGTIKVPPLCAGLLEVRDSLRCPQASACECSDEVLS
jgi:hypothetical protein